MNFMNTKTTKPKSRKAENTNGGKPKVKELEKDVRSLDDDDFRPTAEAEKLAKLYRKALGVE